jgi:hypothetical protein
MTTNPPNPHRKSTAAYPKSTVDLGLEKLIWVKNSLQTPALPAYHHSLCPITTREWNLANQKPAETGQKMKSRHHSGRPRISICWRDKNHLWYPSDIL